MNQEKIGKFIRSLRESKKMTQDNLADEVGVTRQAVSNWELGKAIPDSGILLSLSELFQVTINELLKGEKDYKDTKENEELENIALNLVDEYNIKSLRIKRIMKISVIIITAILLTFFLYYFVTSYNTISVYKLEGEGNKFFTYNGIMINTKQKSYIRLGELQSDNEENIEQVTLYYYDKNHKKRIIYKDSKSDILITETYDYEDYYPYSDFKYIKKKLILEIEYSDGQKDTIKLSIKKDFTNSLLLYIDKEDLVYSKKKKYNSGLLMKEIDSKMKKYGTKEDYYYTHERNVDGKKINFLYSNNDLTITISYDNIIEVWKYSFSKKNIITYTKVINEKIKEEKVIKYKNPTELSKNERKIYEKAIENFQKYLGKLLRNLYLLFFFFKGNLY